MSVVNTILTKVFGSNSERELKKMWPVVEVINELEPSIKALSDDELAAKTTEFKARLEKGETIDELLPEVFAVAREASWRVLQMRHFDVQLIGGMVLRLHDVHLVLDLSLLFHRCISSEPRKTP